MISSFSDLKIVEEKKFNVVFNDFSEYSEIVFYKNDFTCTYGNFKGIDCLTGELLLKNQNINRSRKFEICEDGVLRLKDGFRSSISNTSNSLKNARKRALDNIYGYALCNEWKYFLTLTFSPSKLARENDEEVKGKFKIFKQSLQNIEENVKILAIPERHPTSGALHLHCLVGDISLEPYLTSAINPKTGKKIFSHGKLVYNLNLFKYGFSTVVKTDDNCLKISNYLTKYILKDFGNIGYNKRAFYRTRNLNFKTKKMFYFNSSDFLQRSKISKILNSSFCEKYKENDNFIVYRFNKQKQFQPVELVGSLPVFDDVSVQEHFFE